MRRALAATLAAAVSVGSLAGGCTSSGSRSGSTKAGPTPTGSSRAAGLTPVRPLRQALPAIEKFVEHERGLTFKHPVKVALLGQRAFLKKLHGNDDKPKSAEVEQLTSTLARSDSSRPDWTW